MINRRIGSFIALLRKEQNLTQEQFARKLGVTNRSVSRWENGNTLPDLSLMYCICDITGITLPELLNGARQSKITQQQDITLLAVELAEREKQAKKKQLNLWFSLGLITILAAFPAFAWFPPVYAGVLIFLGLLFHGTAFYHNNRDFPLNPREKAILTTAAEGIKMVFPDELLQFAKRAQNAAAPQYKTAFQMICKKLAEGEYVSFAMVADEYMIDSAPAIWHAGIAVTQSRLILCGETMVGLLIPRSVLNIYNRNEILSVQHIPQGILIKTTRNSLTIRGDNIKLLADLFQHAVEAQK